MNNGPDTFGRALMYRCDPPDLAWDKVFASTSTELG